MGLRRLIYLGAFSVLVVMMFVLVGCGSSSPSAESETTRGGGEDTGASTGPATSPETTEATGETTEAAGETTSGATTVEETMSPSEDTSGGGSSEQAAQDTTSEEQPATTDTSPEDPAATESAGGGATPGAEGFAAVPDTLAPGVEDATNGPLKDHRLVSYYGHPWSDQMGVLGEYQDPQQMVDVLKEQAAAYTAIDPDLPAIPTIELIASVAQPTPGPDGLYLNRTPSGGDRGVRPACGSQRRCCCLLDVQIGYSTVAAEVEALRPFLERPYVHLALDPEYDMAPGEVPGQQFGSTPGVGDKRRRRDPSPR